VVAVPFLRILLSNSFFLSVLAPDTSGVSLNVVLEMVGAKVVFALGALDSGSNILTVFPISGVIFGVLFHGFHSFKVTELLI